MTLSFEVCTEAILFLWYKSPIQFWKNTSHPSPESTYKTQLGSFIRDCAHLQIGVKTKKVNLIYIEWQPRLTLPLWESRERMGEKKKKNPHLHPLSKYKIEGGRHNWECMLQLNVLEAPDVKSLSPFQSPFLLQIDCFGPHKLVSKVLHCSGQAVIQGAAMVNKKHA